MNNDSTTIATSIQWVIIRFFLDTIYNYSCRISTVALSETIFT